MAGGSQVDIDTDAVAELLEVGGDVDDFCHEIVDLAYDISQRLVPQPGRPGDPYAKGPLKASGKVNRGTHPGEWELVYGTDHWQYVEYGTRHMKAEPFMRPALLGAVFQKAGGL